MSNLKRLMIANFFWGLYFVGPVLTIFLLQKELNFTEILLLESVLVGVSMLFEIPTGVIADRFGRKWSLVASGIVIIISWIIYINASSLVGFIISMAISGIGMALISGTNQALFYDILKEEKREGSMQKQFGIFQAVGVFAGGIAALIGGWVAVSHSPETIRLTFYLTMAAIVVSIFFFASIKEPQLTKQAKTIGKKPERGFAEFREGLKLISTNKKLKRILLLFIFTTSFPIVLFFLYPPYLLASDVPNIWLGIALFISSFLVGFMQLFAYKIEIWFGVHKGMLFVTLMPAVLWGLMALIFHPVFAILLFILNDGFGNLRNPIFADYQNRHIPSHIRATVLSTISFLSSLYLIIVWPLIGFLADINLSYAFGAIAVIIVVGAFAFRINEKHIQA